MLRRPSNRGTRHLRECKTAALLSAPLESDIGRSAKARDAPYCPFSRRLNCQYRPLAGSLTGLMMGDGQPTVDYIAVQIQYEQNGKVHKNSCKSGGSS